MSDDEYYYESPYDDFNDILYDADPSPDLADDLAEHAAHSPVWQDEPVGELRSYFSDWEYYSDDYYDDDPNILRKQPADGTRAHNDGASFRPHGRKRKLSEAREPSNLREIELKSLASCLRGTVWATDSPERVTEYKPGQQQKIALTLSKSIMQSAYSYKRGFGKQKLRTDDSWANDLSLNEMGLQPERQSSMQQEPDANNNEDDLDEYDEDEDDGGHVTKLAMHHRARRQSMRENGYDLGSNWVDEADMADGEDNTAGFQRRKRPRLDSNSQAVEDGSPQPLNTDADNAKDNTVEQLGRQPVSTRGRGRSRKAVHADVSDKDSNTVATEDQLPAKTRAKRKRGGEEEGDLAEGITNGRASKRIASAKIAEASKADKEESTTTRTRRSRRT